MQIGIVGLPYSGKSTLFATLLSHKPDGDGTRGRQEAERGIVKIPDERLDTLTRLYNPRRKVNATIEYLKVPGLEKMERSDKGLPAQFIANLKTVDAILLMVRAFDNDLFPHPFERIDPKADIEFVNTEFLISDLLIVENRLEKLAKSLRNVQNADEKKEFDLLQKCRAQLEEERPLREMQLADAEEKVLRGFQFLTAKPLLYVININEKDLPGVAETLNQFQSILTPKTAVTALCAEIEGEIGQLGEEDQQLFLEELGIERPALYNVIHHSHELMGLMSFFTVGEDECRSWTIRKGINARKAAGVIHSDLERGFIRAEVVSYDNLIKYGSMPACKANGVARLEGKEYVVQDGDIMEIRFNV